MQKLISQLREEDSRCLSCKKPRYLLLMLLSMRPFVHPATRDILQSKRWAVTRIDHFTTKYMYRAVECALVYNDFIEQ